MEILRKEKQTKNYDLYRDVLSEKRFKKYLDTKIPNEVQLLQKVLMSADLSIPVASIDPGAKPASGESSHYEIFKVSWQSSHHG